MENKTVPELREIAKLRRVCRYYSLRKAELIGALTTTGATVSGVTGDLLDSPVPVIQTPVLNPTPYIPPQKVHYEHLLDEPISDIKTPVIKPIKTGVMATIKSYADWLVSFVPEKIKKPVNDKLEALKSKVVSIFNRTN
jgi:hypothetical protein